MIQKLKNYGNVYKKTFTIIILNWVWKKEYI